MNIFILGNVNQQIDQEKKSSIFNNLLSSNIQESSKCYINLLS